VGLGDVTGLRADAGTLFDLRQSDRRDMKSGVAAAMAMAPAPIPSGPGKVSYSVNGARFRGQNAVAGSVSYRLNTSAAIAVGAGFSYGGNKNNGVRVGVAGEF
jgi:autotransporter adhesin